ncbi:glycoprotein [Porton virus]|uniref:glycoprotein n=1 Tax=Porton virus TaxID=1272940 RepID=UPI002481A902|nr:glycoprotein [Porton virus]UAX43312.1 glycoprotein [Porton virus]
MIPINFLPTILLTGLLSKKGDSIIQYKNFVNTIGHDRWEIVNTPDSNGSIVFPTMCTGNWTRISFMDLTCPTKKEFHPDKMFTREVGSVYHPRDKDSYMVDGYICHKQRWSAICEETWYFSTTQSSEITNLKVTEAECRSQMVTLKAGEEDQPFFPPHVCAWSSKISNDKDFVILTPHAVKIDIYNDSLKDPMLSGGVCYTPVCETIHDGIKWIAEDDDIRTDYCDMSHWERASLFIMHDLESTGSNLLKTTYIRSSLYGIRNLHGSCGIQICGVWGVRFATGEWWAFSRGQLGDWEDHGFKHCEKGTKVSFHHDNHGELELYAAATARQMECARVLGSVKGTMKMTPMDLALFAPVNPGVGWAYKILFPVRRNQNSGREEERNGLHLYRRNCHYHQVFNVTGKYLIDEKQVNFSTKIGNTLDPNDVYITYTNYSAADIYHDTGIVNASYVFFSLNGLMKFGNYVYTPDHLITSGLLMDDFIIPHQLEMVEHVDLLLAKSNREARDLIYRSSFNQTGANLVDKTLEGMKSVKNFFVNLFNKGASIIWWAITGITSVIIFIILIRSGAYQWIWDKCSPKKKGNLPRQANSTQKTDIEMSEYKHIYDDPDNIKKMRKISDDGFDSIFSV